MLCRQCYVGRAGSGRAAVASAAPRVVLRANRPSGGLSASSRPATRAVDHLVADLHPDATQHRRLDLDVHGDLSSVDPAERTDQPGRLLIGQWRSGLDDRDDLVPPLRGLVDQLGHPVGERPPGGVPGQGVDQFGDQRVRRPDSSRSTSADRAAGSAVGSSRMTDRSGEASTIRENRNSWSSTSSRSPVSSARRNIAVRLTRRIASCRSREDDQR